MEYSVFSRPAMRIGMPALAKTRFDFLLHFLDQVAPAAAGFGDRFGKDVVAPRRRC